MRSVIVSLWALFAGLALLMLGNGLQGTLLGVRASLSGIATSTTGMVMACYYVGYLAGSWAAPRWIRRVGHVRVFAGMASLVSLSPLVHALVSDQLVWALMRFLSGAGMVSVFIVVESWLNGEASNANRGRLIAAYIIVCQTSIAAGQFLMGVADPLGFELFVLISALCSLAVIPLALSKHEAPNFEATARIPFAVLRQRIPLALGGVLCVSLTFGAFYAVGPVYALKTGLAPAQIGPFMAATVFGSILCQWPLGMLSDRMDRRRVILALCLAVTVVAATLALLPATAPRALVYVLMFAYGGLSFPLYPLFVALAGDSLSRDEYVAACSRVLLVNGLGSAIGPMVVALLMEHVGTASYPVFIALVHAAAAGLVWHFLRRRTEQPLAPAHFTPVMPQSSVVATEMAGKS